MPSIRFSPFLALNLTLLGVFCPTTSALVLSQPCESGCDESVLDQDGDGLSDCVEACIGTSDIKVDTDSDGMSDGFEYKFGLQALSEDANDDLDGDEMTNLEEFLADSDPTDANSPHVVYYVDPAGSDIPGAGSNSLPWQSVGFALESLVSTNAFPARLIVQEGTYVTSPCVPE